MTTKQDLISVSLWSGVYGGMLGFIIEIMAARQINGFVVIYGVFSLALIGYCIAYINTSSKTNNTVGAFSAIVFVFGVNALAALVYGGILCMHITVASTLSLIVLVMMETEKNQTNWMEEWKMDGGMLCMYITVTGTLSLIVLVVSEFE